MELITDKIKVVFKNGLVFERVVVGGDFRISPRGDKVFLEMSFDGYEVEFDMADVEYFEKTEVK